MPTQRSPSDPRVFTVASYNESGLAKSLNDLRDKSLLTLSGDRVSRVELLKKGKTWSLIGPRTAGRFSSPRQRTQCRSQRAGQRLQTSARDGSHCDCRCNDCICPRNSQRPRRWAPSSVQTLEVRKNKDDYFAKSSAVAGVYKVDSALGQALNKRSKTSAKRNRRPHSPSRRQVSADKVRQ